MLFHDEELDEEEFKKYLEKLDPETIKLIKEDLKELQLLLQTKNGIMNFNCIFTSCNYKRNNIEEEEFLKHLKEEHHNEILDISKKENIPIKMAEMIATSNSKVFINSQIPNS